MNPIIVTILAFAACMLGGLFGASQAPKPEKSAEPEILPHWIWRQRLDDALEHVTLESPRLPDGWENGIVRPPRDRRSDLIAKSLRGSAYVSPPVDSDGVRVTSNANW